LGYGQTIRTGEGLLLACHIFRDADASLVLRLLRIRATNYREATGFGAGGALNNLSAVLANVTVLHGHVRMELCGVT
jgi:hypothetical protein